MLLPVCFEEFDFAIIVILSLQRQLADSALEAVFI